MQVFVLPLGPHGCELYYETPDADPAEARAAGMKARLQALLAEADAHRHDPAAAARAREGAGRWERLRQRALGWMAERITEQRLLWHLQKQSVVTLVYPADLTEADARRTLLATLERDETRHGRWLVVDAMATIGCAALILLPGPNVVGYYFLFMTVSHFLAWRGARQGLRRITWAPRASDALAELRGAIALGPPARVARVAEIAARLGLPHLASFVERVAGLPAA